ncbi:MAG: substrate-binding domain-containing protein [Lachnospiraceae bacterium]|nr:substrate-binding domain-containing protein [Lachnospiraceae bacterium]
MRLKKVQVLAMSAILAIGCMTGCGKKNIGEFDASSAITVVSREAGSGTRGAFVELFEVEQKDENGKKVDRTTVDAITSNSTSVMMTTVAGDLYGIGYISLGAINDTVKAVKINGVEASVENIKNGSYEISRPFNIATKEDLSDVAKDFVEYILSEDGQKIIEDAGYISVSDAKAYEENDVSGKIVVAGSSSVTPVMEKLKEGYEAVNSDVEIEIQESDSTTGMTSVIEGICDIGMASRDLKDSEIEEGITGTVIALDGIAVIVNNDSIVEDLSVEDVMNIYIGEATNWSEIVSE